MTEDALQIATARLLDYTGLIWTHVPNGGKRNLMVALKLKRMGTKAGVPDILIFNPAGQFAGVAIELKVDKNKTSDKQKQWLNDLTACGWACHVCRSIDQVIEAVKQYYPKHL